MRSTRRSARAAAVVLLAVAVGTGCGSRGAPKVAAWVQGRPIPSTRTDRLAAMMARGDAMRSEVESGDVTKKSVTQVVLAYLIRLNFLEELAGKMGVDVSVDPKESEAIAQLPPEAFTARGWGAGDLQTALRATRLSKAVAEKVFPSPGVSEEDVRKYYDQRADQFRNFWHAEARVAFFKTEGPAKNMPQKVVEGQSFSDAARALGAEQEGSLGEVTPDAPLGQPIISAIAALRPGQVSTPIAAGGGYFVVTINQRVDTPARTFEEVKGQLVKLQQDSRRQELFYDWLNKQLAKAKVSVNRRYGRWDPQTLEVI